MLEIIVIGAEALVVIWFAVFMTMIMSMYLDSRGMKQPVLTGAGRLLVLNAKFAFIVGMVALAALTVWEVTNA
ncbi:hypothetical protein JM93_02133 [Roseibium hamelinense]|uniref:Uncharacterized protein n=1 Tax=Roseibium hamelinense TaxID=150831 RepID=A0A562T1K8_9HYPH|nr:hypothetical protein [Roseibium hamelinense]MTI43367.1 hypothetical protein [Roseibium hamelinense]TWI87567.1 hypothetical protein JM93_02133 [Roseibium hamelinense]